MQALVFRAPHAIKTCDVAEPACGENEVLVRVSRAGRHGTAR